MLEQIDTLNKIGEPLGLSCELVQIKERDGYLLKWMHEMSSSSEYHFARKWYATLDNLLEIEGCMLRALASGDITMNIFKDTDLFPYMSGLMMNGARS